MWAFYTEDTGGFDPGGSEVRGEEDEDDLKMSRGSESYKRFSESHFIAEYR